MKKLERINREAIYKGAIIDVYKDKIKDVNGNMYDYDFIDHKGAAAVLPITSDEKVILVKQYRNAQERYTLEIPAGGYLNKDERPIECAKRELEEEIGYKSDNLKFLITIVTTVAFCNEKIEIFVARDLIKTQQNLDEGEYIEVVELDFEEVLDMIKNGEIIDSKTVSAVLAYKEFFYKLLQS